MRRAEVEAVIAIFGLAECLAARPAVLVGLVGGGTAPGTSEIGSEGPERRQGIGSGLPGATPGQDEGDEESDEANDFDHPAGG